MSADDDNVRPLRGPGGVGAAKLVAIAYEDARRERQMDRAENSRTLSILAAASRATTARLAKLGQHMPHGAERTAVIEAARSTAIVALKLAARAQALSPVGTEVDPLAACVDDLVAIARLAAADNINGTKGSGLDS